MSHPLTLYHFTPAENLPSIRKRGLVPRPLRLYPHMGGGAKAVWLNSRPENAADWGCVMLTAHLDPSHLHLDPDPGQHHPIPGWSIYPGTIPPDKIVFPS